ncbi:hypothetical protein B0T10DRAFT_550785 [Thelonectria olida]|uniref:Uncharacterized protein n=1 Tax=Thelonectria olida TaxID=1576542 RepID=A0A9P8W1U7_9HYPO|nr:hypothetical protein B0T10DRAFT_550785 [Thelonectria olida]
MTFIPISIHKFLVLLLFSPMLEHQSGPGDSVFNPVVYEGLWRAFHKPAYQQWTLTVTTIQSIVIFSLLTIFVTLIQNRAWVISRYVVWRRTKPVALPPADPSPILQETSQVKAARDIIGVAVRLTRMKWRSLKMRFFGRSGQGPQGFGARELEVDDDPCDSNWYGIVAIILYAVFTIIGIVLPFLISDGTMGPPIVRSKATPGCLASDKLPHLFDIVFRTLMVDDFYDTCISKHGMNCDQKYFLTGADIETVRVECPFDHRLCLADVLGLQIIRKNITFLEAGVNSPYDLTISHRISCSPVHLDFLTYPFTNQTSRRGSLVTVKYVGLDDLSGDVWPNMSMRIFTENGPGRWSNERSGLIAYQEGYKRRLTILPHYLASGQAKSQPELLHPWLRQEWAAPWVAVFQAGDSRYGFEISDPFFSARNCHKNGGEYNTTTCIADHEATAVGCTEQYSICSGDLDYCSPWLTSRLAPKLMWYLLNQAGFEAPAREVAILMYSMTSWFSVFEYIGMVTWLNRRVPVTDYTDGMGILRHAPLMDKELWVEEVKIWFRKSILAGLLHAQLGANFFIWNTDDEEGQRWKKEYGLCGRVLFRDPNHINIDWIGLWISVASLGLVWIFSWCVDYRGILNDFWKRVFIRANRLCWATRRTVVRMMRGLVLVLAGLCPRKTAHQEPQVNSGRPAGVVHENDEPELHALERREPDGNEELDISDMRFNHSKR